MSSFPACNICKNTFRWKGPEPFLLPCLHAVCKICLTSAGRGNLHCPTCKRDFDLQTTTVHKDQIRQRLVLNLTAKHRPSELLCTHEDDGNQAVCWCQQCEELFCEHCQNMHGRFKALNDHTVQAISDIGTSREEKDSLCSVHKKYVLELFDIECGIPICLKCRQENHSLHITEDVPRAYKKLKKILQDHVKTVTDMEEKMQLKMNENGLYALQLDNTASLQRQNISNTFATLKSLLDQRQKEITMRFENEVEKMKSLVSDNTSALQTYLSTCSNIRDYAEIVIAKASKTEFLSITNKIKDTANECLTTSLHDKKQQQPCVTFVEDDFQSLKLAISMFSKIDENVSVEFGLLRHTASPLYSTLPVHRGASEISVKEARSSQQISIATKDASSDPKILVTEAPLEVPRGTTKPLAEVFKPKEGSWDCSSCYCRNDATQLRYTACQTLKPGTKPEDFKPEAESASIKPNGSLVRTGFKVPEIDEFQFSTKSDTSATLAEESQKSESKSSGSSGSHLAEMLQAKDIPEKIATPAAASGFTITKSGMTIPPFANVSKKEGSGGFSFGTPIGTPKKDGASGFNFDSTKKESAGFQFNLGKVSTPVKVKEREKAEGSSPFKFTFSLTPSESPQAKTSATSPRSPDDGDYYDNTNDEDSHLHFEPIVSLPEIVDMKTGEEEEITHFEQRAKLFRFRENEWKERGLGTMKILEHADSHRWRLLMRRQQIFKVCCNHYITQELELRPMTKGDGKAWVWFAQDFAEEEVKMEHLAIKFKTKEIAEQFKKVFDAAKSGSSMQPVPDISGVNIGETTGGFIGGTEATLEEDASEVEFLFKAESAEKQKARVRKYLLPDNVCLYENKPPCPGCIGCEAYNPEKPITPNETCGVGGEFGMNRQLTDGSSHAQRIQFHLVGSKTGLDLTFNMEKVSHKVRINIDEELCNNPEIKPYTKGRFQRYSGTTTIEPLRPACFLQYWEALAVVTLNQRIAARNLILELGVCLEVERDRSHWIGEQPNSYTLHVAWCQKHMSVCRVAGKKGRRFVCVPDTFSNTEGTSATLHYGVVYDFFRAKLAFIDVRDGTVIAVLDNVDTSQPFWPMFGVFNPGLCSTNLVIVVGKDIHMSSQKKSLILKAMFDV